MPVKVMPVNVRMDFGDVNGGIFGAFTTFNDQWRSNEVYAIGVGGKVIFNPTGQSRLRLGEGFVQDDEHLSRGIGRVVIQCGFQDEVGRGKDILGEKDA